MTKSYHQCPHCEKLLEENELLPTYTMEEVKQMFGLSSPTD